MAMLRGMEGGENTNAAAFTSPAAASPPPRNLTMSAALPPSSLVAGSSAGLAGETMATATEAEAVADRGPFAILPGFAVVPANGEVSFEVAFSPVSLGETG